MTSQTRTNRQGWRRAVTGAVASGALVAGVLAAAPLALAQPNDSSDEPTPTMTADQALAVIAEDYDLGSGGGQVSQLIHQVMTLRNQGFRPSNANKVAIQEAIEKRPNQAPLVAALSQTLSYQRKIQAQQAAVGTEQSPAVLGRQALPPGIPPDPGDPDNSAIGIGIPGNTINQPVG